MEAVSESAQVDNHLGLSQDTNEGHKTDLKNGEAKKIQHIVRPVGFRFDVLNVIKRQ